MADLEKLKKDYAELIIRSGVNLQKGQRLSITSEIECADFVRLCAEAAYDAGCQEVLLRWTDDKLTRMKYLKAADEVFDRVDSWIVDRNNSLVDEGCAFLTIYAEDPESLNGVDPDRIKRAQISSGKALEYYRGKMMSSACPWCVCSIPSKAWSRLVFPDLSEEEAIALSYPMTFTGQGIYSTIKQGCGKRSLHAAELMAVTQCRTGKTISTSLRSM